MEKDREKTISQLERLLNNFERMELEEYLLYVNDRRRLFRNNLLIGMARGLGSAIGFTVLSAVVIVLLQHIVVENIPVIGDFLAEVVRIVQTRLNK